MAGFWDALKRILNPKADLSWLRRQPQGEPTRRVRAGRLTWRLVLLNFPFIAGLIIVLALLFFALFGPRLAPYNPYLTAGRSLEYVDGKLVIPPWPPSEKYPLGTDQWGRDIYSMLLWGTRNTIVTCLFVTMARLLIGLMLGAVAGWNEGRLVDRVVMRMVEVTTSLPMLLVGMIAIFALDIRRGITVFIVALCFVGWGEMAQYIRSEFLVLRQKPFVEGARAIGLSGLGIVVRHLLPNVLPSLVVLTLLEMGAVLMILGELGFVGVFIGGGHTTEMIGGMVTFPTIPEWGAMMADSRRYARSFPWMVFYPALAFFISVLGFNLLSEGLRRIIREAGVNTAALLSKRMILVVMVISAATYYIVENVGPAKSYANLAYRFDEARAMEHVRLLCDEEHVDRRVGAPGNQATAEYIAAQFEAAGLQPGGKGRTYFQPLTTRVVYPVEQPQLALLDVNGQVIESFRHQVDFGFSISRHGGSGQAQAPLRFVGFTRRSLAYEDFKGLDLRGRIALCLEDNVPFAFDTEALIRGAQGVLVVSDQVKSQSQLAPGGGDYLEKPTLPVFRITPAVADRILAPAGLSVGELRARIEQAKEAEEERGWFTLDLNAQVRMSLSLGEVEEVTSYNVLGMLSGQDVTMDDELLIVSAHYDNLGRDPDGTTFVGANDGASGVAVLMEIARLWGEQGFEPNRTVLFVAWTGGQLPYSGAHSYLNSYTIYSSLRTVGVFQLDRLGRGGDTLLVGEGSALSSLLERSARAVDVPVRRGRIVHHVYQTVMQRGGPTVTISWEEADAAYLLDDTTGAIDPAKLGAAGRVVNLALITASREARF
jgi:peptide/nickel transport system permease protein